MWMLSLSLSLPSAVEGVCQAIVTETPFGGKCTTQAAAKILPHLVSLLKPYTVSITPSLPSLHTRLLALKPLFDFLRRHAARQAHEFQKAYVQTVRWYLETAFRRYVRALEKIRTSSTQQQQQSSEPIGIVNAGVDASLGEHNFPLCITDASF